MLAASLSMIGSPPELSRTLAKLCKMRGNSYAQLPLQERDACCTLSKLQSFHLLSLEPEGLPPRFTGISVGAM